MRFVVLGAGAIGGTVGALLADSGHDVVLVARGEHAAVMRRDGVRVATPARVLQPRLPVEERVRDVGLTDGDVLLLTAKSQDTVALLDDSAAAHPAGLPVVCLQNGVANERMALRRFADVYGVVVMMPAVLLEPGRIDAQGAPYAGLLDIGRVPGGVDDVALEIAAAFVSSGFTSQPVEDVMAWKRAKLLRNVGNAIEALCGHDLDEEALAIVLDIDARMRAEAEDCFSAAGLSWVSDAQWMERRGDSVQHASVEGRARAGGSTWQSLARGTRSVEADYLNGEVVLLGRLHDVATPVNEAVRRLANEAARTGAKPGSMQHTQLLEAVSAAMR